MQDSYNGWTNWHTWNTNLWLNNEENLYSLACKCSSGQELAELWLDLFPANHDNINEDLVNWEEIYKGFQE